MGISSELGLDGYGVDDEGKPLSVTHLFTINASPSISANFFPT
jgi:hypothetical protein